MTEGIKPVRPWDLWKQKERVSEELHDYRMSVCVNCEHFIKLTKQCVKCGCFMSQKTKLHMAACPVGKWPAVIPSMALKVIGSEGEPTP